MPKSKLELSVEVFRGLAGRSIARGRISGTARAEDFPRFVAELGEAELLVSSRELDCAITFVAPSAQDEFFAASIPDLIAGGSRKKKSPSTFFVADLNYLHDPECADKPEQIRAYLDTICLVEILSKIADHGTEPASTKLVFFHKEKVEVLLDYTADSLSQIPELPKFRDKFIDDDIHSEQKKTIIKSVLLELSKEFEGQPITIELIIGKFEEFSRRVSSGYQLYVSEFSFQKVKAEVEKSKFEFIARINKVFSEIQNQLLAVPAALIIAGSQFETAKNFTLKNSLILGGALAFTLFMILLIVNQRNTLRSIFNEIGNEWSLIKKKHGAIKAQFNDQYRALETRYKYQCVLLEVVALIVISACFATTALFIYYSSSKELSIEAVMTLGFFWIIYIAWRFIAIFPVVTMSSNDT